MSPLRGAAPDLDEWQCVSPSCRLSYQGSGQLLQEQVLISDLQEEGQQRRGVSGRRESSSGVETLRFKCSNFREV